MNTEKTSRMDNVSREQRIIRTSIIGIIANVLLAGFKAAVGLISSVLTGVLLSITAYRLTLYILSKTIW